MLTNTRLRYFWYILAAGILLMSIFSGSNWIAKAAVDNNLTRWVHFLAYVAFVAIPVVARRKRISLLLPLIIGMTGVALELLQTFRPGSTFRPQNVIADLFGICAGILLGLNLRTMRVSNRPNNKLDTDQAHSTLL